VPVSDCYLTQIKERNMTLDGTCSTHGGALRLENLNDLIVDGMLYYRESSLCRGYAVVQLVEALRYKPEGRGFDSRWCHWNLSLT